MRFLSADLVYPIHIPPVSNGVVVVDDSGKIIDLLIPGKDEIPSSLQIEKFNGIICPGFVNTHCHLELSHLKGKLTREKGLPDFIGELIDKRSDDPQEILQAMVDADNEMFEGGIVAVGDISNNSLSSSVKNKSKIVYHTFVELFDIFPERTDKVFSNGLLIQKEFSENGNRSSIVPHSIYTVTKSLMKLICDYAGESGSILSIHNQESSGENEMFTNGTGQLIEKLQELTGAYSDWKSFGKSSLYVLLSQLNPEIPVQLVHNTFTGLHDIQTTLKKLTNVYWCLCVNANLFIENTVPDILNFVMEKCILTVGTDSYASNTSLSVLDEMITIKKRFPQIELPEMLSWATINGADYLGLSRNYGSFEKGKSPGINLISNIELAHLQLNSGCKVQRLI